MCPPPSGMNFHTVIFVNRGHDVKLNLITKRPLTFYRFSLPLILNPAVLVVVVVAVDHAVPVGVFIERVLVLVGVSVNVLVDAVVVVSVVVVLSGRENRQQKNCQCKFHVNLLK